MTEPSSPASPAHAPVMERVPLWRIILGFSHPVDRRTYLAVGVVLMAVKYLGDAAMMFASTGELWTPAGYLLPWMQLKQRLSISSEPWVFWTLVTWSLPFMWVGASMSVRRAMHAGMAPGFGLMFLAPVFNWVTIVVLAMMPGRDGPRWQPHAPLRMDGDASRARAAVIGVLLGAACALCMVLTSVQLLGGYGSQLFLGAPLIMGVVAGYVFNRARAWSVRENMGLALVTLLLASGSMLLFALEGAICVAMAFPLAFIPVLAGVMLGRALARPWGNPAGPAPLALILLLWPAITGMEARLPPPAEREGTTTIDVDAPPEVVWDAVIHFGELPEPTEWFFRLGIAYPVRARMEGTGVGAVRHCEFTTGPFVEPITTWDPPRQLAFTVRSQPPAMREVSPYNAIQPPHFDGYLASRRGRFLLEPLPGGRTRLSGTTWFASMIHPEPYWSAIAEAAIHAVHLRVLEHVKRTAEAAHAR